MNTNDPTNLDPLLITTGSGTQFTQSNQTEAGAKAESESDNATSSESETGATTDDAMAAALAKASKSHQRLRALLTLRTTTAPRDSKLEKTMDLPREQRLGEVTPMTPEEIAAVAKASGSFALIADTRTTPHPWHRFAARTIDFFVCVFITAVPPFFVSIAYSICNVPESISVFGVALTGLLAVITSIVYEPLMLSMWGTTLGKSIFNIKVREQRTGEYLTFVRAFQRMLWVAWYSGKILSIVPFVGIVAPVIGHLMQYKKLIRDKITSYDERMRIRYEHN